MRRDIRMRRKSRAGLRLYGWLTWRNAIRLCLPGVVLVLMGVTTTGDPLVTLVSLLASVGVGLLWISFRWHGHHPEYHVYHLLRWYVSGRRS